MRVTLRFLELFLRRVQRELGIDEAEVTICLVSDAEIAEMNESFRKKHGPTDVLSFTAMRQTGGSRPRPTRRARRRSSDGLPAKLADRDTVQLGDIAIAPAVARRNAKLYGRTLPAELKILVLHGVLHLLGYDHEEQTDQQRMRAREEEALAPLGLSR